MYGLNLIVGVVLILISRHQPHIPASPWGAELPQKNFQGARAAGKGVLPLSGVTT